MASFNKAILLGNLGRDPDFKTLPNGNAVCNFSIATSEKYKGEEKTEWHRCSAFGKTAELCGQYLKKGRSVLVEGKIQYRKYMSKEGVEKDSTEILVDRIQFLGGKGGNQEASQGGGYSPQPSGFDDRTPPVSDEEIPF